MSRNNPDLDSLISGPVDTGPVLAGVDKLIDAYKKLSATVAGTNLTKTFKEAQVSLAAMRDELARLAATPLEGLQIKVSSLEETLAAARAKMEKAASPFDQAKWAAVISSIVADLNKFQGQIDKLAEQEKKATADAAKEAAKLRADQFAAAAKAAKEYFDEEERLAEKAAKAQQKAMAQTAKETARLQADIAKAMAASVAEQEKQAAALAAEVERLAKEAAKVQAQEWADLIETRKTLDAQAKKDIQAPAAAAKASAAAGTTGGGLDIAGAAITGIGALAGAAAAAGAAVIGMAEAAAKFVKFSDPASVLMMNMAMEDLQAAIGSGLTPIVNAFTVFLDQANAAITQFQPIIEGLTAALSGTFLDIGKEVIALGEAFATLALSEVIPLVVVFQQLWDSIKPLAVALVDLTMEFAKLQLDAIISLFEAAQPAIKLFMDQILHAAQGLAFMAKVVGILIEAIRTGRFDRVGGRIGDAAREAVATPGAREPAGTRTTAARPATQISSEAIGEQARAAAYSGRSIAEQQLAVAQQQSAQLQQLINNTRPGGMAIPTVNVDPPQP